MSAEPQYEAEVVDGEPVLEQELVPAARESALLGVAAPGTAVRAAAAAAGGFVAGAAVLGLVHRHQRKAAALARPQRQARLLGGRPGAEATGGLLQIVGTRSLLVDVHLLGHPAQGSR